LAGTLTAAGTVLFGYESAIYSSNPTSTGDDSKVEHASGPALAGFVTKYDHDGRVLWSRLFAGADASSLDAISANSKVVDVSAMNDRVYVVGYTAGDIKFQSCEFRTHSGGAADVLSENAKCVANTNNFARLTGTNFGVFVVAYDASGVVQWIKNYRSSVAAKTTVAACAAVSSLKTARPLTGNTIAWNNLQTLLGRNQPVFGEPNDVGSEFREVGAAAGRWLYVVGSYIDDTTITLAANAAYSPIVAQGKFTSAKEPAWPVINAGTEIVLAAPGDSTKTNVFLIKIDAATGVTQWGSEYGPPTGAAFNGWHVVATDVAADPVTGNVYLAGTITNPELTGDKLCNHASTSASGAQCGVDIFNMGTNRKVGCPQDPRPVLSSKACSYSGSPYAGTACGHGILNKERGLPYCRVVPLNTASGSKTSGFVAAISEIWTDEFGRTIAIGYSSDTTAGVTNVAWFKLLGNGHGHEPASALGTTATSKGSKLAIHDTDVIVSGTYAGHPASGSVAVQSPGLQFPGVHSLFQDNVLLPASERHDNTKEGLFASNTANNGGFLAWLVD